MWFYTIMLPAKAQNLNIFHKFSQFLFHSQIVFSSVFIVFFSPRVVVLIRYFLLLRLRYDCLIWGTLRTRFSITSTRAVMSRSAQGEAKEGGGGGGGGGGVEIWGEWILKSPTRPQVASLSSPCSDFISSLGATTAGNIWVLSYKRPTSLLFSWELKDGQSCAETRGIFIWMHIMLCSQYSGTFSAYLRISSEAFSSTESLISDGFMCFILPPCQPGPHAWWAGRLSERMHYSFSSARSQRQLGTVQRLSLRLHKGQAVAKRRSNRQFSLISRLKSGARWDGGTFICFDRNNSCSVAIWFQSICIIFSPRQGAEPEMCLIGLIALRYGLPRRVVGGLGSGEGTLPGENC